MASALENLTKGTTAENPVSFDDWWKATRQDAANGSWDIGGQLNPNGMLGKLWDKLFGDVTSARQAYDNYLTGLQNKYTAGREDTAIQRQVKDALAAGLNPLALLSGNAPSGASSSAAAEFSKSSGSKSSKANSLITSALKLLAILAIKG